MTRTIYYVASTLDGFIADQQHSLDWLIKQDIDQHGAMNYNEFIAGVGAVLMGAATYEWLRRHQTEWPYTQPSWVFTHRDLTGVDGADIRFTSAPVVEVHAEAVEAANGQDVWVVGGGDLAGQFADAGLLDEIVVSYAPVTLGAGAPLLPRRLDLRLRETARNEAFVAARYDVLATGDRGR
ncbi:dihydrofolate reductase family protein [Paractinoplanes toevensis]|uniref:Dihydrofolate reductase n=1 Tax=Paractinoplanes toevensis TaxID=571911 RepID=A0A919T7P9_9ACTN|nr:dihydrofolate reductase family protein [Actinoplanes toevensis]GIM89952.1 dihydrofolate reductase [Actinoplanes toevensis]